MDKLFWDIGLVPDNITSTVGEYDSSSVAEATLTYIKQFLSPWQQNNKGFSSGSIPLVSPAHIILAVISLFYDINRQPNTIGDFSKESWCGRFRYLSIGLLFGLPIAQLVCSHFLDQETSVVDGVYVVLVSLTWLLHILHMNGDLSRYTGPVCVILVYFLTLVIYYLSHYYDIKLYIGNSHLLCSMEEYCIYISVLFHSVYVLTLKATEIQTYFHSRRRKTGKNTHSFFSLFTYSWIHPLLCKGYNRETLTNDDIIPLPDRLNVRQIQEKFYPLLQQSSPTSKQCENNICKNKTTGKENATLLSALHKMSGFEFYFICGILQFLVHIIGLLGPISLNLLISYFERENESKYKGWIYAFGLFLSSFLSALLWSRFDFFRMHIFFKVRISIMTTIYRKTLGLSTVSLAKFSNGEIINFLGTDTDRTMGFCHNFHALWGIPFEVMCLMYLLHTLVGTAFLGGFLVALVLIPINKWISKKQIELGKTLMEQKDKRTKMMNEILNGIKIIKFYTWENHFRAKIDALREAELQTMKYRKCLGAVSAFLFAVTPAIMTVLTFTLYTMMGHTLTAATIFTSLSLFVKMMGCFTRLPWVFNAVVEALISYKRLESFVAMTDIDLDSYYTPVSESMTSDNVLSVKTGKFTWETAENQSSTVDKTNTKDKSGEATSISGTLTLRGITINIKKGQFIGVTGKVGSGKSSLLNALLAEMSREEGKISISNQRDGFALAGQEAWIQQATIRDNILFGQPFDSKKYSTVLYATSLKKDLKILPSGDLTEVGENGVTLSGGQRTRVALARALYQDKDVYLLDDPLAAVDAHVAKHINDRCILGMLKNKTRILCTHHTKFLGNADLVIVLDDGVISKIGSPSEVLTNTSFVESKTSEGNEYVDEGTTEENKSNEKLSEDETKETGVVKLRVYKAYISAIGKRLALMMFLSIMMMQVFKKLADWWLTHWVSWRDNNIVNTSFTEDSCPSENANWILECTPATATGDDTCMDSKNYSNENDIFLNHLIGYGCLTAFYTLFILAREVLFAYGGLRAAKVIHGKMFNAILKAPMSFFDVTPIGRIVNRFSSDMGTIDDSISGLICTILSQIFGLSASIIVACCGLPLFILILLPILAVYRQIQEYYRPTSREIRRITKINRSPIYAHFSETLSGLTTIRAYRNTQRFLDNHYEKISLFLGGHYTLNLAGSWFRIRAEMLGVVMVTGISVLAVVLHHFDAIDPSDVGLAIAYTLSLSGGINGVVNCFTETEKQMVSVERAQQYIDGIKSEKWTAAESPLNWPSAGVITYEDVTMQYRDGLPNVLQNLTFVIRSAEKVGIVGRTGSGKSSIFQSLFRIVELRSGKIMIDGVNIQQLNLKDVRRHLAVIPQDPFLFSGTVKENLDPTMCHCDDELWEVLHRCHLRLPVERLGGLDGDVAEKGRHFSVGQRQLMCLARALLTRAKILCIDEATASVDLETDMLIQETIRKEFAESTVLTIAHRINTIMDSDRVLVMDHGQTIEFDTPKNLLEDRESAFYSLVHGEKLEKS